VGKLTSRLSATFRPLFIAIKGQNSSKTAETKALPPIFIKTMPALSQQTDNMALRYNVRLGEGEA